MDQGIMTLITAGLVLAAAVFVLWLLYTVIWRAVRRGMQEFEFVRLTPASPVSAVAHHHRHVQFHLPRHAPAEVVPDYPPREWF
jgi:hypothetical protein